MRRNIFASPMTLVSGFVARLRAVGETQGPGQILGRAQGGLVL